MAEFLSAGAVLDQMHQTIERAQEHIFLVNPVLKINPGHIVPLGRAHDRGVHLSFLYGCSKVRIPDPMTRNVLNHFELFCYEKLNIRCCFNEEQLVIISHNPFQVLQSRSGVAGLLLHAQKDQTHYEEVVIQVLSEAKQGRKIELREIL